jgi:hypothetical protein
MNTPMFTETHAKLCGAAILGLLSYCALPYIIPVAVGAVLGYMLVDADINLPGPRNF